MLVLESAHASDAGRYVCVANNSAGSERVEHELHVLHVLQPLSVHVAPPVVTADVGRGAELTCSGGGLPAPSLTWAKDGVPLRDHRVMHEHGAASSRLRLAAVQREDRGMYQCFARNDFEVVQATAEIRLGGENIY